MALVNFTQAAKMAGISRSYFHRKYIKQGVLSVTTDADGNKKVDTSELLRVFGELKGIPVHSKQNTPNEQGKHSDVNHNSELSAENETLKGKLAIIENQAEELRDDKKWLKLQVAEEKARAIQERLRAEKAEIKLLEHLSPPKQPSPVIPPDRQLQEEIEELKASLQQLSARRWWQVWK